MERLKNRSAWIGGGGGRGEQFHMLEGLCINAIFALPNSKE